MAGPTFLLFVCIATGLVLSSADTDAAAQHYRYRNNDGNVVFTDVPVTNGTITRTSYNNSYGRAMATASCAGVSDQILAQRSAAIANVLDTAAKHHAVDPLLIKAIARVESCFDTDAVSRAGAQGLMQLMPATAREMGVRQVFNPAQNLLGGSRYIAEMMQRYGHNHRLALAAYNAGPGNVDKHRGVPPFAETRNYIERVLQHYREYGNAPGN